MDATNENLAKIQFGKNIKKYRELHKETTTELAKAIGSAQSSVSDWENGNKMPRSGKLQALADHWRISIDDLVSSNVIATGSITIYSSLQDKLLDRFNQLTESNQEDIVAYTQNKLSAQQKDVIQLRDTTHKIYSVTVRGAVSAGTGELLQDEHEEEVSYFGELPVGYDFAVTVKGDSMLPLFKNGQVIFVSKAADARDGQIVIANVNGDAYVKKLQLDESGITLISLNKKFDNIKVGATDAFKIFGVVLV